MNALDKANAVLREKILDHLELLDSLAPKLMDRGYGLCSYHVGEVGARLGLPSDVNPEDDAVRDELAAVDALALLLAGILFEDDEYPGPERGTRDWFRELGEQEDERLRRKRMTPAGLAELVRFEENVKLAWRGRKECKLFDLVRNLVALCDLDLMTEMGYGSMYMDWPWARKDEHPVPGSARTQAYGILADAVESNLGAICMAMDEAGPGHGIAAAAQGRKAAMLAELVRIALFGRKPYTNSRQADPYGIWAGRDELKPYELLRNAVLLIDPDTES